ncbi:trimeric intracellular cation channel family protein, partial [Neptunomonas phycophila]|uniref:trimeric intracellular cation channel family protein n=2 Tax=Oceanospirillaceae TaxID=135620 RepID=UPI00351166CD
MINTVDYNLLIGIAEIVGTAVFAITGAIAAQGKRLDIFGVVVLAIVAAVGGGTVRDVILDASPVFWVVNNTSLYVAIVSAIVAFIACRYLSYPRRLMLILDAAGLALFVVLGAEKAHSLGMSP